MSRPAHARDVLSATHHTGLAGGKVWDLKLSCGHPAYRAAKWSHRKESHLPPRWVVCTRCASTIPLAIECIVR